MTDTTKLSQDPVTLTVPDFLSAVSISVPVAFTFRLLITVH